MYHLRDCYEWIDPVETVDRLIDEMNRREEDHEREAAYAARAFSEATYAIRRQAEEAMRPALDLLALSPFVRSK